MYQLSKREIFREEDLRGFYVWDVWDSRVLCQKAMGWEFRFFVAAPSPALLDAARAAVGTTADGSPEVREDVYVMAGPTCGMKVRSAAADEDIFRPDADVEVKMVCDCERGAEKLKKVHARGGLISRGSAGLGTAAWDDIGATAWAQRRVCRVRKTRWASWTGEATLVEISGGTTAWLSVCVEGGGREAVIKEGSAVLARLTSLVGPPTAAPLPPSAVAGAAAAVLRAPTGPDAPADASDRAAVIVGGYARWLTELLDGPSADSRGDATKEVVV